MEKDIRKFHYVPKNNVDVTIPCNEETSGTGTLSINTISLSYDVIELFQFVNEITNNQYFYDMIEFLEKNKE